MTARSPSTITARRPASSTSTRPRARKHRVKAASSRSPRARRSRCAFSSIRSPRAFPTASPTPTGSSGNTSWTRWGAGFGGQIPALENLPLHNEDGAAAATFMCRVALQGCLQARLRARLFTSSFEKRTPHAGHGHDLEPRRPDRAAATAASSRKTRAAITARPSARGPRRNDSQRRFLLRKSIDREDKWGIPVLRFHWK